MKAVILAGGYGKRLRPLTDDMPKPLVEIGGRTILEIQLDWLKEHGIDEAVLCVGFLKEKIIQFVGNGSRFGVKASYVVEDSPMGTGGAILNAEPLLRREERFLVLNGDVLTTLSPTKLVEKLVDCVGVIALVPLKSPYGIIDMGEDDRVKCFREKPVLGEYWINAGVYCLTPDAFKYLAEGENIESKGFPKMAEEGKLKAVRYGECFWKSIDVYKDIEEAEKDLVNLGLIPPVSQGRVNKVQSL